MPFPVFFVPLGTLARPWCHVTAGWALLPCLHFFFFWYPPVQSGLDHPDPYPLTQLYVRHPLQAVAAVQLYGQDGCHLGTLIRPHTSPLS